MLAWTGARLGGLSNAGGFDLGLLGTPSRREAPVIGFFLSIYSHSYDLLDVHHFGQVRRRRSKASSQPSKSSAFWLLLIFQLYNCTLHSRNVPYF